MTVTVRLDKKTEKLLDRLSRSEGLSRSEVIRRGIRLFAEQRMKRAEERMKSGETTPYALVKHLIGRGHGGKGNLSERTGDRFYEMLTRKARSRR